MKKNISSIFILGVTAMLSVLASCNKLSQQTVFNNNTTGQQPVTPDSVILKPGIIVIDSTQLTLLSTQAQLAQGTYVYTTNNTFPTIIVNDIIIGVTGEGYLRKVTSVSNQAGQITLNTSAAKLEDVFQQANINFATTTPNLLYNHINNFTLFQDANASATIAYNINNNPNWNFNMQFQGGSMTGFSAVCNNGSLSANVGVTVTSSTADNINATQTLTPLAGRNVIWIGQLPIVVTTYVSYVANISGSVAGSVNHTFSFSTNDNYTLGDVYASGAWQNQYSYTHTSSLTDTSAGAGYNIACSMAPQMTLKIYGVVCPSTTNSLNTIETTPGSTFSAGFAEQQTFSVAGSILGYSVPDNSFTRNTDTVNYHGTTTTGTNLSLVKISGDGQTGTPYQYLTNPLIVQVTDNTGAGQANITVTFTVTSGGGALSHYTVVTNSGGFAQTNWEIGNPATSSQMVQASASTSTGAPLTGSPVTFTAL